MSARLFLFYALILFFQAGCGCNGSDEKPAISVQGHWELVKGIRNQKETETLQGVYFQFDADGTMMTNLPVGSEVPVEFELKKNEIHQKTPQPIVYFVQSATDSTLVLTMEMRGAQFEMYLRKAQPPIEQDIQSQPADNNFE